MKRDIANFVTLAMNGQVADASAFLVKIGQRLGGTIHPGEGHGKAGLPEWRDPGGRCVNPLPGH
jgi:hypothetical protein